MSENFTTAQRKQVIFWLFFLFFFIIFLWAFRPVLLPFIAGMTVAYLLDPAVDFLEHLGLSRLIGALVITSLFIMIFILVMVIFLPLLINQIYAFVAYIPALIPRLHELISLIQSEWLPEPVGDDTSTLQNAISQIAAQGVDLLSVFIRQIWNSGKAMIDIISLLVVTPVVAFYILQDWDNMVKKIDTWLPQDYRDTIREIILEINATIASFVRGQGMLCLILGGFYGISLSLFGLNFGFLIGLFAGLVSFIPYVGSITGLVLSLAVAITQFWPDWMLPLGVAAIFIFGQFVEGNVLQPKLVGKRVGLHPVWLMFSLFAFGSLFGFTGLLIAVPLASAIGVIARFALTRYLESEFYKGRDK